MNDTYAITNGRLITPSGVIERGSLIIRGKRIDSVGTQSPPPGIEIIDARNAWVLPGLIDLHVMGGFGQSTFEPDPELIPKLSRNLPSCGVTGFLPACTTFRGSTEPLRRMAEQIRGWDGEGARPLGILGEGPFIHPDRKGAFTLERVEEPSFEKLETILEACDDLMRIMMIAPEKCLDGSFIERIAETGVVAMGHCQPSTEQAHEAVRRGVSYATHVFNAMGPFNHREPGAPGVALVEDNVVCELICDGCHVHPDVVKLIARAKGPDRIALVTDSLPWLGLPPGQYERWGLEIESDGATARQLDGTLVGTVLPLHQVLKRFVEFTGWPLHKAARCATRTPARVLGIEDERGTLDPGAYADFLLLTNDFEIEGVWIEGRRFV